MFTLHTVASDYKPRSTLKRGSNSRISNGNAWFVNSIQSFELKGPQSIERIHLEARSVKAPDLTYQIAFGVTSTILSLYMLITTYLFWKKRSIESIKKRMVPLVLFTALCSIITMNMSLVTMDSMLEPIFQYCIARLVVQTIFAPSKIKNDSVVL